MILRNLKPRLLVLGAAFVAVVAWLVWSMLPVRAAGALERARDSQRRLDAALVARDYPVALRAAADLEKCIDVLQRALEKSAPPKNVPDGELARQFQKSKGGFFT